MRLLEISREVALVAHPYSVHNLFYREECVLEESSGFLHPKRLQILRERHSGFGFEEIAQVYGREIHGA